MICQCSPDGTEGGEFHRTIENGEFTELSRDAERSRSTIFELV